jgi:hypothetical protein
VRPWEKHAARAYELAPIETPAAAPIIRERRARELQLRWVERQRATAGQRRLPLEVPAILKAVGQ